VALTFLNTRTNVCLSFLFLIDPTMIRGGRRLTEFVFNNFFVAFRTSINFIKRASLLSESITRRINEAVASNPSQDWAISYEQPHSRNGVVLLVAARPCLHSSDSSKCHKMKLFFVLEACKIVQGFILRAYIGSNWYEAITKARVEPGFLPDARIFISERLEEQSHSTENPWRVQGICWCPLATYSHYSKAPLDKT
jgi:hypothetical protein